MDIKNRLLSVLIAFSIITFIMSLVYIIVTNDIAFFTFITVVIVFILAIVSDVIYDEIKRKR